ncbi:hypothetical protein AGMMS49942_14280 [Spirochaetia bacterium]|nr:hypothetical protein AGMMS49942_14280 [Spirochaetia bacterium]
MTFGERMKELLEQGAVVSREFAAKAGAKAQELGEIGVLKLEIMQFEGQAQKLIARLGAEVYSRFSEAGALSVSRDEPLVAAMLGEITAVKEAIERREEDLRRRKGQG